eukprot:12396449-Ditylum_brightwellii.AAC.1
MKKILTENPSSIASRRTHPKRNINQNKYVPRNSKHVNKVKEDEISVSEEETELDKEQEDEVSNNGDVVHISLYDLSGRKTSN